MTPSEWEKLIVAAGGGGGFALLINAFAPLVINLLRGKSKEEPAKDRESSDPVIARPAHVSHPELKAELASIRAEIRAELHQRIEAAEADCARRVEKVAARQDENCKAFAADARSIDGKVERLSGLIKGYFDADRRSQR